MPVSENIFPLPLILCGCASLGFTQRCKMFKALLGNNSLDARK